LAGPAFVLNQTLMFFSNLPKIDGPFNGSAQFLKVKGYSQMLSGLYNLYDPRHLQRIENELHHFGGTKELIDIPVYTLNEIFTQHQISHVDLLSIDTEGSEEKILQGLDLKKFDVDIIVVENNFNSTAILQHLTACGYNFLAKIGWDDIYRKRVNL